MRGVSIQGFDGRDAEPILMIFPIQVQTLSRCDRAGGDFVVRRWVVEGLKSDAGEMTIVLKAGRGR